MKTKAIALLLLLLSVGTKAATNRDSTKNHITYRATIDYGQSFLYGSQSVTAPYHLIRGGMHIAIPIKYGLDIETGLKYGYTFGKKTQRYAHSGVANYQYNGHLIDLPIRLHYTLPIFWGLKLFAYAGPNLNIGIAQQQTIHFTQKSVTTSTDLPYPSSGTYNAYDTYNRFNLQLGAGGGIQWKKLRIRSGYDWGINDLNKKKTLIDRMKGWHVGIEYEF